MSDSARLAIAENRRARKWSRQELLARVLWGLVGQPLFRCSPRLLWGWRRGLLRLFGAHVGSGVHIYPSVRITLPWQLTVGENSAIGDRVHLYNLGPLVIGRDVTISQGAHLCGGTHDYTDRAMALVKARIAIDDGAWICADAFIGPHVSVGARAIVGARAVVMRDVPAGAVMIGNPARCVKRRP